MRIFDSFPNNLLTKELNIDISNRELWLSHKLKELDVFLRQRKLSQFLLYWVSVSEAHSFELI